MRLKATRPLHHYLLRNEMKTLAKSIFIGLGATLLLDCWSLVMRQFGSGSHGVMFAGRWISYFAEGTFIHDTIIETAPASHELIVGRIAHYAIGVLFALILVAIYGKGWLDRPRLKPALIAGIITLAAPVFIFQPAVGFGIAFSKMPDPVRLMAKITVIHLVYGAGLYLAAQLLARLSRGARPVEGLINR